LGGGGGVGRDMTSRGKLIEYVDVLHGGVEGSGGRKKGRERGCSQHGVFFLHAPMDPRAVWRAVRWGVSRSGTLGGGCHALTDIAVLKVRLVCLYTVVLSRADLKKASTTKLRSLAYVSIRQCTSAYVSSGLCSRRELISRKLVESYSLFEEL
jgi:hypothetical protein